MRIYLTALGSNPRPRLSPPLLQQSQIQPSLLAPDGPVNGLFLRAGGSPGLEFGFWAITGTVPVSVTQSSELIIRRQTSLVLGLLLGSEWMRASKTRPMARYLQERDPEYRSDDRIISP